MGVFNTTYVTNGLNIQFLADELWTKTDDWITQFIDSLKLFGDQPLESIINIRFYPFSIKTDSEYKDIVIGKTTFDNVKGYPIEKTSTAIIDLGEIFIEPKFNNFLDYPPYTSVDITFPFIGTTQLDTSVVMGKHIQAKYIIDYLTGIGTAVIFCDNIIIGTLSSQVGIDVAISSSLSADFSRNVINTVTSNFSGVGGIPSTTNTSYTTTKIDSSDAFYGGGFRPSQNYGTAEMNNGDVFSFNNNNYYASDGVGSDLSRLTPTTMRTPIKTNGLANLGSFIIAGVKTAWDIANIPVPVMTKNSSSPMNGLYLPQYAYCTIRRPISLAPENYGHKYGYSCFVDTTLNTCSGFTVCANPEISSNATEIEISEIKKLLMSGVII